MSLKEDVTETIDSFERLTDEAEQYVRKKIGMTPLVATVLDVFFAIGGAAGVWIMWHTAPIVRIPPMLIFGYFMVVSLASLYFRFFGGKE